MLIYFAAALYFLSDVLALTLFSSQYTNCYLQKEPLSIIPSQYHEPKAPLLM